MSGEIKNIIKVASIYITTVIGAGFASGREIVQFFSTYYDGGFYGIILAGGLFAIIGYIVLDKVYSERIRNYDEFLFPTVGWFMGWVMQIVVSLFMLSLFCIMLAGMGNIFVQKLEIPFNYGILIMAVISLLVILTGIKGVVSVSTVLTPILIAGIIAVGVYVIVYKDTSVFGTVKGFKQITGNWFFSSVTYVSYNSIMSVVIMCSLLPYLKTRRVAVMGGVMGGIILCIIAFILNTAIFLFPETFASELPVLAIIDKHGSLLSGLYSLILWMAMFTSAVTSCFCFIDRVSKRIHVNMKLTAIVACALAIPLSSLGFSNLIASIYPIFGYLGFFMIFAILFHAIKQKPFKRGNK